jgi:hypothetical protein
MYSQNPIFKGGRPNDAPPDFSKIFGTNVRFSKLELPLRFPIVKAFTYPGIGKLLQIVSKLWL